MREHKYGEAGHRLRCSAAVPGCEFKHRPGARLGNWRRDAAPTRRRGRLRYSGPESLLSRQTGLSALRSALP
jgi:hypothetical protein